MLDEQTLRPHAGQEQSNEQEQSVVHQFPEIDFATRSDMVIADETRGNTAELQAKHSVAYLKTEVEHSKASGERPRAMPLRGEITSHGKVAERYTQKYVECDEGRIVCSGIEMELPQDDGSVIRENFQRELDEKGRRIRETDTVDGRIRQDSKIVHDPNTGEIIKWEYTEYDDKGDVMRTNVQERNKDGAVSYHMTAVNEVERQGIAGKAANGTNPEIHPWVLESTHGAPANVKRSFS